MIPALATRLAVMDAAQRRRVLAGLTGDERRSLAKAISGGDKWAAFENDPVAFVREGLGETIWSKQAEILESVRDNKRTIVPACHAPGKSHIASRAVAWWVSVHPPGTALVATTASQFRQVRNILWPHIRRVAVRHQLPGFQTVNMVEWQRSGEIAAYGFASSDYDETSVQGIHAPHLLVVIDEAGGIGQQLGQGVEALMTGDHTRLLVLGNPPTDNEDSWFERACSSPLFNVVPISAYDTPNFTGEDAGICVACPPLVPAHNVATHLVDVEWVNDVIQEMGEDSPFVQARVFARFTRNSAHRVIPADWVEMAVKNDAPAPGSTIRLGVDIAADGGDEFVIARADGFTVEVVHSASGAVNENAVDVAGVVLRQIQEAEATHAERDEKTPVRVKIDAIGVGWGVVGTLQKWKEEGRHASEIVPVNVGERARDADKFLNVRAEMWWNGRILCQPTPRDGDVQVTVRLNVSRRCQAQFGNPLFKTDSAGRIVIEKKSDMKKRGVSSPDQAEAVLLALFEPPSWSNAKPAVAVSVSQTNAWKL